MPLHWLVLMVVGGIAGAALSTWALGWARAFQIVDEATARREWQRHWPDLPPRAVHLAADRRAALIETEAGPGLLRAFGADTVAHLVRAHRDGPEGLWLDFGDFGSPPCRPALQPDERARWGAVLNGALP